MAIADFPPPPIESRRRLSEFIPSYYPFENPPSLTKAWEKGFSDSQRQKILSGSGGSPVKFWNPLTLLRYSMAVASGFGREIVGTEVGGTWTGSRTGAERGLGPKGGADRWASSLRRMLTYALSILY